MSPKNSARRTSRITRLASIALAASLLATVPVGARAALSGASRVGPTGVGPIVIGTTPAQAQATGTTLSASVPAQGSSCYYLQPDEPKGLAFMVESGTIRRAEIRDPAIVTTDGFRVGDSLDKIRAFYGARAHVGPAKYDPRGQTVTIDPRGASDVKYRLVFEVLDGVVTAIFAGALPQVLYVEGCS